VGGWVVCRLVAGFVDWLAGWYRFAGWLVAGFVRLVGWLVGFVGWWVGWLAGWLVGCLADWWWVGLLVGCWVCWFVGCWVCLSWLVGKLISCEFVFNCKLIIIRMIEYH